MTAQDVDSMLPFNNIGRMARATCNGDVGWGLFEDSNLGRHDHSGFTGWGDLTSRRQQPGPPDNLHDPP